MEKSFSTYKKPSKLIFYKFNQWFVLREYGKINLETLFSVILGKGHQVHWVLDAFALMLSQICWCFPRKLHANCKTKRAAHINDILPWFFLEFAEILFYPGKLKPLIRLSITFIRMYAPCSFRAHSLQIDPRDGPPRVL